MKLCVLLLSCKDRKEANKITTSLLSQKLVFCVKQQNIFSQFLWNGKIDKAKEVLLIMESKQSNFSKIEKEVAKIHSYETFTLYSTPVQKTTKKVLKWINKEQVI